MTSGDMKKTIFIFEHQAFDTAFQTLYEQGMRLIEETAAYIDGEGISAVRNLSGAVSTLYTGEAMRISTRLMQVASWLLLMRAGREKEMATEQIASEKARISLNTPSEQLKSDLWQELPQTFRDLVERSLRLEERVRHLDYDLTTLLENGSSSPVNEQLDRLNAAFPCR